VSVFRGTEAFCALSRSLGEQTAHADALGVGLRPQPTRVLGQVAGGLPLLQFIVGGPLDDAGDRGGLSADGDPEVVVLLERDGIGACPIC
jgi:hypothetical protein